MHNINNTFFEGKPKGYIKVVIEPEFGCEGRNDDEVIYAELEVITDKGEEKWKIEESELWRTGLDDGMWIVEDMKKRLFVVNDKMEKISEIERKKIIF